MGKIRNCLWNTQGNDHYSFNRGTWTGMLDSYCTIPPWFAFVHPKTGTPIYATLLITLSNACIAFFSSLDVLISLLSISTLFIFMMMAVALLVRRYCVRGTTPRTNLLKLAIFLFIVASSMSTSAYWGLHPRGWAGYTITVPFGS
ncbi:UNVERIFIED_CONTAM: Cationic amino acid transporter 5 [Sesamum indicum]